MSNPALVQQMMDSNPMLRNMTQANPQVKAGSSFLSSLSDVYAVKLILSLAYPNVHFPMWHAPDARSSLWADEQPRADAADDESSQHAGKWGQEACSGVRHVGKGGWKGDRGQGLPFPGFASR